MRPRLAVSFLCVIAFAVTGCDLVSDPDGPRPEDFEVQEETSEVRVTGEEDVGDVVLRQDVAAPLSTVRGGLTRSITAPR